MSDKNYLMTNLIFVFYEIILSNIEGELSWTNLCLILFMIFYDFLHFSVDIAFVLS